MLCVTYGYFLIRRSLLGLHGFHRVVNLIVVRRLDATDRNSIVNSSLVNSCRKRVLGELKLRSLYQSKCISMVGFAGVLEQLPDLLGSTRAGF